jgi:hypothetical protein
MAASASGSGPDAQRTWLEREHPEFTKGKPKWIVATDVYSGDIMDPLKLPRYLVQRATGEHDRAFEERMRTVDFTNHFATVVDGLAGMLFAVEDEATRVTVDEDGFGLGDADDPSSTFGQLWRHANPEGDGWLMVFKQLLIDLCVVHQDWLLCFTSPTGAPMVKTIPPLAVPNWRVKDGQIVEVLVEEDVDARMSLTDDPDLVVRQFMHYRLDGYQRYQLEKRASQPALPGTVIALDASNRGVQDLDYGSYAFKSPRGDPALPIFRVKLPMKRDVGYLWARKQLAIFNQESARDAILRTANFPKLNLGGTRDEYQTNCASISAGSNTLHQTNEQKHPNEYIAPGVESATVSSEVLKQKVEEFFNTAHQSYGESAKQRTATEARQDVAKGAGAFLNLTKQAIDDAEAACAWRIAQILHPTEARHWWAFSVSRSSDFLPSDPDVGIERLQKRILGTDRAVPVGIEGKVAAAQQIVGWQGVAANDDQLIADVKARELLDLMETNSITLPPDFQVYIAGLKLAAIGKISLEEAEALLTPVAAKAGLKAMQLAAERAAEAKAREAETFPKLTASGAGGPNQDGGGDLTGTDASTDIGSRPDGSSRLGPRAGV